jgi:hypothetical protein
VGEGQQPDEEGRDAGPTEAHADLGPRDARATERGEAREESRQARPEDLEPGPGALEALARSPPSIAGVLS